MLLDAATRHIDTLRVLYRSDEIPDEVFGFHVQQAAEKLLKGWIALLGEVYPLTHDVEELLNLLVSRDSAVEPFRDLVDYTPYAVEFRYMGVAPDAEPTNRKGCVRACASVARTVRTPADGIGGGGGAMKWHVEAVADVCEPTEQRDPRQEACQ